MRRLAALSLVLLDAAATPPDVARRYVETGLGERVAVTVAGDSASVVIVADALGGTFAYRKVVEAFRERGVAAVIIEPLGTGRSSAPRGADYSASAQAARVGQVMDTLAIATAVVVGHGYAASIGLRVALQRAERVRGVVSIAGGPMDRPATDGGGGLARLSRLPGARRFARREIAAHVRRAMADPSRVDDALLDGYTDAVPDLGGAVYALRQASALPDTVRLLDSLHRLSSPLRLIIGSARTGTGIRDDEIEVLRRLVPDFDVILAEGSGSLVHEERPNVAVDVVMQLVEWSRRVAKSPSIITRPSPPQ
jgi:pimeloyl-ACP methyl ester carboxylesterase